MALKVHQHLDAIFFSEPFTCARPVQVDASREIRCDTNIESTVALAGKDIDV